MQYNSALDGLRALTVLTVLAFHSGFLFSGGFIGVDVFFVLSGFLITSLLRGEMEQTGRIRVLRFYWRRALRLWPPLLLMLATWAVVMPFFRPGLDVLRNGAIAGLYLSDYFLAFGSLAGHLGHTWSLAVEEHFYLLWPLVVLATGRIAGWRLAGLFAFLFVAASSWRMYDLITGLSWHATYHRFDTRMSGLIIGSVIAVIPWRPQQTVARSMGAFAAFGLLVMAVFYRWGSPHVLLYGGLAVDIVAACLVLSLTFRTTPLARLLAQPTFVYVGLISYSIYLWHFPIAAVARGHFGSVSTFLITGTLSIAISAISYEWMEKRLKAMRHRQGSLRDGGVQLQPGDAIDQIPITSGQSSNG